MLGNFPQAYSHVGLINCALNLSRQSGPTEEGALSEMRPPKADTKSPEVQGAQQAIRDENERRKGARREK
jgi:hypothetical protein